MNNGYSIFNQILLGGYFGLRKMIGTQEENLFIDFKEKLNVNIPGAQKEDRKIYGKALSGFSNSSGGVIIWGGEARKTTNDSPDIATEEKPIKNLKKFLTDLNSLVNEAIIPLNTGIINSVIYLNDDETTDEGFLIAYVPESGISPHRALFGDNQYYTRAGDSFIKMEHHMLEDAFGRRQKPKLKINYELKEGPSVGEDRTFSILIGIENIGKYLATYPAIRIKTGREFVPLALKRGNYNLNSIPQSNDKSLSTGYLFAGGINDTIHPYISIDAVSLHPTTDWFQKDTLFNKDDKGISLSFEYEIFAEGCMPLIGKGEFTAEQIIDFLEL
ncbi:ATP-binding protein [Paenibacillus sp. FSL H3-0457]|uniref:AlbA family DNA-binding domain-containing protein n=1 Tax=Paenibacillus sp. FSL H3-0457 TaxID=2921430 RepID=UPI0030ED9671